MLVVGSVPPVTITSLTTQVVPIANVGVGPRLPAGPMVRQLAGCEMFWEGHLREAAAAAGGRAWSGLGPYSL